MNNMVDKRKGFTVPSNSLLIIASLVILVLLLVATVKNMGEAAESNVQKIPKYMAFFKCGQMWLNWDAVKTCFSTAMKGA